MCSADAGIKTGKALYAAIAGTSTKMPGPQDDAAAARVDVSRDASGAPPATPGNPLAGSLTADFIRKAKAASAAPKSKLPGAVDATTLDPIPDPIDPTDLALRKAAAQARRRLATTDGIGSTFLTGPQGVRPKGRY